MATRRSKKRGVVLLIVLSLLALFALLVVTFVITAGQYKTAAQSQARHRRFDDDPRKILDMAVLPLIRDTKTRSPIQYHSLLHDFYGSDGVFGRVVSATRTSGASSTQHQWLQIDFVFDTSNQPFGRTLSDIDDYYGGSVFTLLEGPAKGKSTRVLKYEYSPTGVANTGRLYIDASAEGRDNLGTQVLSAPLANQVYPAVSYQVPNPRFVINGAPFNGTGHGYSTSTYDMEQRDLVFSQHTALLPNFSAFRQGTSQSNPNDGGADEGWDAVDYQNMFLAMVPADVTTNANAYIIPSFHRPELINHWMSQTALWNPAPAGNNPDWQEFRRMVIHRPMPWDHPNFTGSNRYLSQADPDLGLHIRGLRRDPGPPARIVPANYWDVDNDGDAIPDSVWVDVGFPARTSADGRIFKPLVAFLIRDLDGRLNLNAHSNIELHEQRANVNWNWHPGPDGRWGMANFDDPNPMTNGVVDDPAEAGASGSDDVHIATVASPPNASVSQASEHNLARGLGYGPAEISLKPVLQTTSEHLQILLERNLDRANISLPDRLMPGQGGVNDELSAIKRHDLPNDYQVGATRGGYGVHPDSRGIGAVGLDVAGLPVHAHMGNLNEAKDDPYEVKLDARSLTTTARDDKLFTLTDLERILRPHDMDSAQGDRRLVTLASGLSTSGRHLVTVHSSHVPTPRFAITPEGRSTGGIPTSARLLDLYRAKLLANGVAPANVQSELDRIVPFELRRGQLFDINRAFGNSRDDNNNSVVDEPMEAAGTEYAWTDSAIPSGSRFRNVAFSHRNNDPLITTWQQGTRQIYARHLYCLMMLLVSQSYNHPVFQTPVPATPSPSQLTAKRIAQWAVNVVDFRDPDAVMTGFEVDLDPFDGWQVDGNLATTGDGGTQRTVVWGCEQPDLKIDETVAFHNRAIKDTTWDDGQDSRGNGGPPQTESYSLDTTMYDREPDQFRKPEGSLYVELYAARNPFFITPPTPVTPAPSPVVLPAQPYNPVFPPELYHIDNTNSLNPDIRLDLGRMSSADANGVRYPVWRLAVANPSPSPRDIAYPPPGALTMGSTQADLGGASNIQNSDGVFSVMESTIERVIWFSPTNLGNNSPWRNYLFYGRSGTLITPSPLPSTSQQASNLRVQPGGYAVIGPRPATYVGLGELDGNPLTYENSPQRIDINPGTGAFTATSTNWVNVASPHLPPVGIICASNVPSTWTAGGSVGMNVSEPLPASGNYYREPVATANIPNGYYDAGRPIVTDPMNPAYNALPDVPFDGLPGTPLVVSASNPHGVETGTRIDFRSVYLQRLADPTLPWNPSPDDPVAGVTTDPNYPVNPYITVDWSTVDLTVFSGDENTDVDVDPGMTGMPTDMDPDDPDPYAPDDNAPYPPGDPMELEHDNSTPLEQFSTRARGTGFVSGGTVYLNHWTPYSLHPPASSVSPMLPGTAPFPQVYFRHALNHTLGHLNDNLGAPTSQGRYVGVPASPMQWLVWNNRPFANPFELMLVPSSSPSRIFYEFVTPKTVDPNVASDVRYSPFNPDPDEDPYDSSGNGGAAFFRAPYAHLLNFFHSATDANAGHFGRLLDFVETPSLFVDTETWYDPQYFTNGTEADYFRPPFNRLSKFRDPGRININTVFESEVWEGISKNFPTWDPTMDSGSQWTQIQQSRRGYNSYDQGSSSTDHLNSSYPTRFANPFRSAVSSQLMPNVSGMAGMTDIQATLLRSRLSASANPLFQFSHPALSTPPTSAETRLVSMRDPDGNAFFRYQGLMRLSNLLTTNSNVYAVWVTVGYFELHAIPTGPTIAHPDGYLLGQEVGADTGTIERHRGFYIIDRSIPVAFELGENHNTEQTILLRRYIE